MRVTRTLAITLALLTAAPLAAAAEPMSFKLLTNYSQASFRSDAPLETFVGTSALEGIQGTLALDPAKPQDAKGTVKVDMSRVSTGIEKRDAHGMRVPQLLSLKVANDSRMLADLVFVRQ